MAYPVRESGPSMVMQTHRQVTVEVEDRRPGEGGAVDLPGPQRGRLERFLDDLKAQGLEMSEDPLIPGVLLTCRLKPRSLQ